MTAGEHEAKHAEHFADSFANRDLVVKVAGNWCLPLECHEIRVEYIRHLLSAYKSKEHYLDAKLHAIDYRTHEDRVNWRIKAEAFLKSMREAVHEAEKAKADLRRCLRKHTMIDPSNWLKPPKV